jgi:hypothetical protein
MAYEGNERWSHDEITTIRPADVIADEADDNVTPWMGAYSREQGWKNDNKAERTSNGDH